MDAYEYEDMAAHDRARRREAVVVWVGCRVATWGVFGVGAWLLGFAVLPFLALMVVSITTSAVCVYAERRWPRRAKVGEVVVTVVVCAVLLGVAAGWV